MESTNGEWVMANGHMRMGVITCEWVRMGVTSKHLILLKNPRVMRMGVTSKHSILLKNPLF